MLLFEEGCNTLSALETTHALSLLINSIAAMERGDYLGLGSYKGISPMEQKDASFE